MPVTTRAGFPSTTILAASSRALASLSRTENDTVNPIFDESVEGGAGDKRGGATVSLGGSLSGGAGVTVAVSTSVGAIDVESTGGVRERRPLHVNAYQKSAAPP